MNKPLVPYMNNSKHSNIYVIGIIEKKRESDKKFKEMAKYFSYLMKNLNIKIQKI